MTRLPTLHSTQLLRALRRAGFVVQDQEGSHVILKHPTTNHRTVVPVHGKDVKRGLMKLILRKAGLSEEDLHRLR